MRLFCCLCFMLTWGFIHSGVRPTANRAASDRSRLCINFIYKDRPEAVAGCRTDVRCQQACRQQCRREQMKAKNCIVHKRWICSPERPNLIARLQRYFNYRQQLYSRALGLPSGRPHHKPESMRDDSWGKCSWQPYKRICSGECECKKLCHRVWVCPHCPMRQTPQSLPPNTLPPRPPPTLRPHPPRDDTTSTKRPRPRDNIQYITVHNP